MKNQELFNRTVSILVKAYQKDTLEYTSPCGCAVGNLIADAIGNPVVKNEWGELENLYFDKPKSSDWAGAVNFGHGTLKKDIDKAVLQQIKKTGYKPLQIAKIEEAFFEGVISNSNLGSYVCSNENFDQMNFNGLMSVVDCLMAIHEANIEEVTEAKLLFVK